MKSLLIFITAFFLLTITSQAQQLNRVETDETIVQGTPGEIEGEKHVSVYQQIEQHSEQLQTVRADYQDKLALAQTEEEKADFVDVITNIDEMLLTNDRLLSGDATIQSVETVKK